MMKKLIWIGASALLLAACNDTATVVEEETPSTDTLAEETATETETAVSDLTLAQVFDEAMARQQALESVRATMKTEQAMEMNFAGQLIAMDSTTTMDMELVNEPMQMHAKGVMQMKEQSSGEEMETPIEIYVTKKDGFYMYEDSMGWTTLPVEQFDTLMDQAGLQNDPSEQLRQLQQFIEDFTFEQNDEAFILTLNAQGDKFMTFLLEQAGTAIDETGTDVQSALENTTIEEATYVLTIDKETFDLEHMLMNLAMTMDMEGAQMTIDQTTDAAYSDYNTIDEIIIPQEIIDSAQPLATQ